MKEEDKQWLKDLQAKSWKSHPPQYSGGRMTSYGYNEDLPVSEEDKEKALELFRQYHNEMVFEPGSGVFGFGVSISAYLIHWSTFPGIPTEPEHLVTLTSKQLFDRDKEEAYAVFEGFTHTSENKEHREKAGFKEKLNDYSYYDY